MATKFFPEDFSNATSRLLIAPSTGGGVQSKNTATVTGPTAGVQIQNVSNVNVSWLSNALNGVTISGTVTFNFWGSENSMSANVGFDVLIERCNSSGASISTIVRSERGVELVQSTISVNNWTATPTSTTLSTGDTIRVTLFGNDIGTMATGFTFNAAVGTATGGASGDSWVQFTETITEATVVLETELIGSPFGAIGQSQMNQLLAQ